ncbi:MAG TPA: DUF3857 domain-containing protein [Pyrinomonadaceae bacterium]|jgi:hypothetical protein
MKLRILGCIVAFLLTTAAPALAAGGDDVPQWLQQAAASQAPSYEKDVPAVVLQDEQVVTIGEDGRITTTTTYAVRVLVREGRAFAQATEFYETDSGKVKELRAWLIRSGGVVKKFGKDEIIDQAADLNDVYNEARVKIIDASDFADVGSVFGYQVVTESRAFFNQDVWAFQSRLPTLVSRYTVNLPAGWRASSVTFNHSRKVEPTVQGSTYVWELNNLPPINPEPLSPSVTNLAPRVAITYSPASKTSSSAKSFDSWTDVSRWYTELADPQVTLDDAIAGKARELTANSKTELEKIRAIARYIQGLQYISIQIGMGRYRPHTATDIFAKSYGDCKDKANLMRTMLKAVKINSYPVLIFSGDPTYVREEWPSPTQFNHAIIAVQVGNETNVPTVIEHPKLGRLLIFDATDDNTTVGDLPSHEQGSFALVAAGDQGSLMRMPMMPPEANRMERQADVVLTGEGSITAKVTERSQGQAAVTERGIFRALSRSDYMKVIETWISTGATSAKVNKIEPVDDRLGGRFALDVDFTAERYAQTMQDRLLIFKPAIVSRLEALALTKTSRKAPVVLKSNAFTETVRVQLPEGFEVDEVPDALKLETPFGNYTATYEVKAGQLLFTRTLSMRAMTIPVEQYSAVRSFFERIRATEQAPVVLAKK